MKKAKVVRIKVEEGKTGLFYATSPDLKGLLVAEPTIDALDVAIPKVITDMFAACGVAVVVTQAGNYKAGPMLVCRASQWSRCAGVHAKLGLARGQQHSTKQRRIWSVCASC
jgi:hypothetical protein